MGSLSCMVFCQKNKYNKTHTMILVCAADDFRKFRKIWKIINFLKIHKKSVISKMPSVWCFFKLTRQVCNHLYLNSMKTALKTLIFIKKLIIAFSNPKISNQNLVRCSIFNIQHSNFECQISNIKLNLTFKSNVKYRISNSIQHLNRMSNIEYQTQSHIQILNVEYRISN